MSHMRGVRTAKGANGAGSPTLDSSARENLSRLESLGIKVDPATGALAAVEGGPFQGTPNPTDDPNDLGSNVKVIPQDPTVTIDPMAPLESDEPEPAPEPEPANEPESDTEPEPEPGRKPGAQTEEGLKKREENARAAQREASKAQAKLDKTLRDVNDRLAALDQKLQEVTAAPRAKEGSFLPPDLSPADQKAIAEFREDNPEAVGYLDALVSPLYNQLSVLSDRLNAGLQQVGQFVSEQRSGQMFSEVYQQVSKAKLDAANDALVEWLATIHEGDPETARHYADVLNDGTGRYKPAAALRILKQFSNETGYDLSVNGPAPKPVPEMDKAPALRSGSALPQPAPKPANQRPSALVPLTDAEAANFDDILARARTEEERGVLMKRAQLWTEHLTGAR